MLIAGNLNFFSPRKTRVAYKGLKFKPLLFFQVERHFIGSQGRVLPPLAVHALPETGMSVHSGASGPEERTFALVEEKVRFRIPPAKRRTSM